MNDKTLIPFLGNYYFQIFQEACLSLSSATTAAFKTYSLIFYADSKTLILSSDLCNYRLYETACYSPEKFIIWSIRFIFNFWLHLNIRQ